jgi:hypothetical protein
VTKSKPTPPASFFRALAYIYNDISSFDDGGVEMKCSQALVVLAAGLGLSACATAAVPVAAVPGPNKDAATFQKDEAACRAEAGRAAYPAAGATTSGQGARASGGTEGAWGAYFAAYSQCEASRGNPVQPVPWSVYTGYPPAYGYAAAYGYPYYGWGYPYYGWGYPWGAYPGFYPGFVAFYGGFGYGFHGGFHGGRR